MVESFHLYLNEAPRKSARTLQQNKHIFEAS